MIGKVLELITGKDDVERIASKEDLEALNAYLKTRALLFPKMPRRFLDADSFTQEELLRLMEQEATELDGGAFELWILEVDGRKRLPAFSSQKKLQAFSAKISKQLNKVFCLGCVEMLLGEIPNDLGIDYVDLNLFSDKSWAIGIKGQAV
jgi:hypothetical protein